MLKVFYILFSYFCLVLLSSCGYFSKDNSDVEIRFVDIKGNSRDIATRIPDLNLKALADQGKLYNAVKNVGNSSSKKNENNSQEIKIADNNLVRDESYNNIVINPENGSNANNDFGSFSSNTIDKTFSREEVENNIQNFQQPKEIEYDLGLENKKAIENNQKQIAKEPLNNAKSQGDKILISEDNNKNIVNNKSPKSSKKEKNSKEIFVQVGSFSKYDNARKFLKYMNKFHKGEIQTVQTRAGEIHRVVLGPMSNIDKANSSIQNIRNSGHDAILLINK